MFPISKLLERIARIGGGSTPRPNELHHVLKIRTVGHFYCHQKLVPIIFVCCFAWSLKLQLVFQYRIPCKKWCYFYWKLSSHFIKETTSNCCESHDWFPFFIASQFPLPFPHLVTIRQIIQSFFISLVCRYTDLHFFTWQSEYFCSLYKSMIMPDEESYTGKAWWTADTFRCFMIDILI